LGIGAFRPKFYGDGVIRCQNVDTAKRCAVKRKRGKEREEGKGRGEKT